VLIAVAVVLTPATGAFGAAGHCSATNSFMTGSKSTSCPGAGKSATKLDILMSKEGHSGQSAKRHATTRGQNASGDGIAESTIVPARPQAPIAPDEAVAIWGTDACSADPFARADACGIANQQPDPAKPKKAPAGPHTPTLTDIASFRPVTPTLTVEPGDFGIVGRPTNFVASARTQSVTGSLFDLPVTVEFTPVRYRFDYGDGSSRTAATGGATWKAGAAPLFTQTGTSHTYNAKAVVTAQVTVAYSARVAFAGFAGWYDVDGYVIAQTPGKRFPLYVAKTVLVEQTCDENPHGPGCP
jgi:hypothetical protein